MKRIVNLLCTIVMMMSFTTSCIAQSKMFKEAAKYEGVTTVYISPAMCKIAMATGGKVDGVGDLDGIKKLNKLEILSCENSKDIEKVIEICHKIIANMNMDVLTEVHEGNESAVIYTRVTGDGTEIHDLIIESREPKEYAVVYIEGEFDLEKIMNSVSKDD